MIRLIRHLSWKCWRLICCMFGKHKYRPAYESRMWFWKHNGKLAKKESAYTCIHCHCRTKWMTTKQRVAFEKREKPSWSN